MTTDDRRPTTDDRRPTTDDRRHRGRAMWAYAIRPYIIGFRRHRRAV
jgi:hypothetical protein